MANMGEISLHRRERCRWLEDRNRLPGCTAAVSLSLSTIWPALLVNKRRVYCKLALGGRNTGLLWGNVGLFCGFRLHRGGLGPAVSGSGNSLTFSELTCAFWLTATCVDSMFLWTASAPPTWKLRGTKERMRYQCSPDRRRHIVARRNDTHRIHATRGLLYREFGHWSRERRHPRTCGQFVHHRVRT